MEKGIQTLPGKIEWKGIGGVLWMIKWIFNSLDASMCGWIHTARCKIQWRHPSNTLMNPGVTHISLLLSLSQRLCCWLKYINNEDLIYGHPLTYYFALTAAVTTIYASLITLKVKRLTGCIFFYFSCSTGSICHRLFISPNYVEGEYFIAFKNWEKPLDCKHKSI